MIICGIDSGSVSTGYGIISFYGSILKPIEFGTIRMKSETPFCQRIGFLFDNLNSIFKKFAIDTIVLEDVFVSKNARSALKLGQIRGAIIACAHSNGIPIREFSPTLVKSAITGNGRAEKSQVSFMVEKILGLKEKPSSFDASDALALAITSALRKEI
jgi:crossover junction endodeoxyribonuclease RuvC